MFQLYKNIKTDFLGEIFLELFQFKTRSLLGHPVLVTGDSQLRGMDQSKMHRTHAIKVKAQGG